MRWALPVLPLRLHGAALNKAQDKLYLTGPEHVNKLLNYVYCSAFLVTCPGAWQLYGIESQHPLRRPVTAAVLRDTILRHIHNSRVHTKDYHRMYQKIRFRTAKNSVTSKSVFYFETSPWILCYYWHASIVINIFSTAWFNSMKLITSLRVFERCKFEKHSLLNIHTPIMEKWPLQNTTLRLHHCLYSTVLGHVAFTVSRNVFTVFPAFILPLSLYEMITVYRIWIKQKIRITVNHSERLYGKMLHV